MGEGRGDGEGGRGSREPFGKRRPGTSNEEGGCIGPSSVEEEALATQASLRWHLDPAPLPGVYLIETASVGETVAEESRCQVPGGPGRLPSPAGGSTKGCVGVQPHATRTARQPRKRRPWSPDNRATFRGNHNENLRQRRPHGRFAPRPRAKNSPGGLDTEGSFREVPPAGCGYFRRRSCGTTTTQLAVFRFPEGSTTWQTTEYTRPDWPPSRSARRLTVPTKLPASGS